MPPVNRNTQGHMPTAERVTLRHTDRKRLNRTVQRRHTTSLQLYMEHVKGTHTYRQDRDTRGSEHGWLRAGNGQWRAVPRRGHHMAPCVCCHMPFPKKPQKKGLLPTCLFFDSMSSRLNACHAQTDTVDQSQHGLPPPSLRNPPISVSLVTNKGKGGGTFG